MTFGDDKAHMFSIAADFLRLAEEKRLIPPTALLQVSRLLKALGTNGGKKKKKEEFPSQSFLLRQHQMDRQPRAIEFL